MHDYQLEELGPRAFEQLTVALARTVAGPALQVYGSGRDGGREATFHGPIDWSSTGPELTWTGYTVVQAKQNEHPSVHPHENLVWLKKQLRAEFDAWMDEDKQRSRFPDNIWIVTNVRLSSGDPGGGIDEIDRFIEGHLDYNYGSDARRRTLRGRGLKKHKVWHRDALNAALTQENGIRQAFPALLTAGDILARIEQMAANQALPGFIDPEQFADVLLDHAHTTLDTQRWVRFDEAGDDTERQSVEKVIVNLPARNQRGEPTDVLRPCLARGDEILRRSLWLADGPGETAPPRHIVVTGAPGNGKSTLARYLTQLYRVRFAERDELATITPLWQASSTEPVDHCIGWECTPQHRRAGRYGLISPRWPNRWGRATADPPYDGGYVN